MTDLAAWREAARWLAEALETGNPLAPLPPGLAPRTPEEGEAVAAGALEALGFTACGLRLAPGPERDAPPVAGPVLEGRLLREGATVTLGALRHPRASAALVAVLAAGLAPEDDAPPEIAALHPAIDVAASRFRDAPESAALQAADLGGLGFVVVGGARRTPPAIPAEPLRISLAPEGKRPPGTPLDAVAALAPAVAAARRLGGLPAGAVLVAAGLGPAALTPAAGTGLVARFGPLLGRVRAAFA